MVIADFTGRQWKRRAGIAHTPVVEVLRFVQVAQGDIGDVGGVNVRRHRMFAADQDVPFGPIRGLGTSAGQMAHGDQRQTLAVGQCGLGQIAVQGAGGGDNRAFGAPHSAKGQAGQIGGAQEGDGQNMGPHAGGIGQRDQVVGDIGMDRAHDMHPQGAQHGLGRLQPGGGIVVARDHHHGQAGFEAQEPGEGGIQEPLRLTRGVGAVKHIARNQQGVDLQIDNQGAQMIQKGAMFRLAAKAGQGLANVPVSGVQNAHGTSGKPSVSSWHRLAGMTIPNPDLPQNARCGGFSVLHGRGHLS